MATRTAALVASFVMIGSERTRPNAMSMISVAKQFFVNEMGRGPVVLDESLYRGKEEGAWGSGR